MKFETIENTVF